MAMVERHEQPVEIAGIAEGDEDADERHDVVVGRPQHLLDQGLDLGKHGAIPYHPTRGPATNGFRAFSIRLARRSKSAVLRSLKGSKLPILSGLAAPMRRERCTG
jgi:hypothetical protein